MGLLAAATTALLAHQASGLEKATAPAPSLVAQTQTGQPAATATSPAPSVPKVAPALGEIWRMVDAHVDAEVIKAYIQQSPGMYNPTASDIIALKDLGASADVLTAMLQHDGAMRIAVAQARPTVAALPVAAAPVQTAPAAAAPVYVYPSTTYTYPYAYSSPTYVYNSPAYYTGGYYGYGWPYLSVGVSWPYSCYRGGWWGRGGWGWPGRYSAGCWNGGWGRPYPYRPGPGPRPVWGSGGWGRGPSVGHVSTVSFGGRGGGGFHGVSSFAGGRSSGGFRGGGFAVSGGFRGGGGGFHGGGGGRGR